jgi:hypothetical protein
LVSEAKEECHIRNEVHLSLLNEIIRRDTLGFDHADDSSESGEESGSDGSVD